MSADGAAPRARLAARALSRVHVPAAGPLGVWALFALSALVLGWMALKVRSFQPDELIYLTEGRGIAMHFPSALWDRQLFPYGIERLNPLLGALVNTLFPTATALTAQKAINAAAFASVVFPVYLLARGLRLPRGFALLAATLAVAVPWLALATSFLNEPVAYPAFAWGIYGCWYAAMKPGIRGDLIGLAFVALAALARTNLGVLGIVLVLAVLVAELRLPPPGQTRGVVVALRRHVPLVIVVALSLAYLVIHGTSSLSGIYEVSLIPDVHRLFSQSHVFLQILAEGLSIVPVVIGAAWAARHLVRPLDRERGLFAVVALGAIAALLYSLYGGVHEERYMIYLAPLPSLAMVVALVRRDVSPWLVGVAALAVMWLIGFTPAFTEVGGYASFAYPAQGWWGHVLIGDIAEKLPNPLNQHPSAVMLAALGAIAVGAVVLTRHRVYGGRTTAAVLIGAQLVVGVIAGRYALDRYVTDSGDQHGADFTTRSWIDRAVPDDERVRLFAEPVGVTNDASGQAAFYNRKFFNDTIDSSQMAALVDPRRDRFISSTMPRYLVVLPQIFRSVGLVGRTVASATYTGYRMDLIELPNRQRIAFRVRGPAPDGWLDAGSRARIEAFAGRCLALSVVAPPDGAVRVTLRSRGAAPVTRRLPGGGRAVLTTPRTGTSVLTATGYGSVPPDRKVSAQIATITTARCAD